MLRRKLSNLFGLLITLVLTACFFSISTSSFAQGPPVPEKAGPVGNPMPGPDTGPPGGPMPFMGPPRSGPEPGGENQQKADDGNFRVVTVNGIETPIAAGTYRGTVILEELDGSQTSYYRNAENVYRRAVFSESDAIVSERSATSALKGGTYDANSLSNVSIVSESPCFNGITIVDKNDLIKNLTAEFSGDGGNDMAGTGSEVSIFKGSE